MEHIGKHIDEVKGLIALNPGWVLIEKGMVITCEYKSNRVRLWYDPKTNIVIDVTYG